MSKTLPIPPEVLRIAETLEGAGHETWCVGGAVRDNLLARLGGESVGSTASVPPLHAMAVVRTSAASPPKKYFWSLFTAVILILMRYWTDRSPRACWPWLTVPEDEELPLFSLRSEHVTNLWVAMNPTW